MKGTGRERQGLVSAYLRYDSCNQYGQLPTRNQHFTLDKLICIMQVLRVVEEEEKALEPLSGHVSASSSQGALTLLLCSSQINNCKTLRTRYHSNAHASKIQRGRDLLFLELHNSCLSSAVICWFFFFFSWAPLFSSINFRWRLAGPSSNIELQFPVRLGRLVGDMGHGIPT